MCIKNSVKIKHVNKIQEFIELNSRVVRNQYEYQKEYDVIIKTYDETKFKYEQFVIESSQRAEKH